jgi:threonyl-tRNA synthetase
MTDRQNEYCQKVAKMLSDKGFRIQLDLRNEKIGFKIREHTINRVPYLVVIGDKEVEAQSIAVRTRRGEDLGTMSLTAFVERLNEDVAKRSRS